MKIDGIRFMSFEPRTIFFLRNYNFLLKKEEEEKMKHNSFHSRTSLFMKIVS